jgi:hypothetical protein
VCVCVYGSHNILENKDRSLKSDSSLRIIMECVVRNIIKSRVSILCLESSFANNINNLSLRNLSNSLCEYSVKLSFH